MELPRMDHLKKYFPDFSEIPKSNGGFLKRGLLAIVDLS